MTTQPIYASFLIRLWQEEDAKPPQATTNWQGEIKHIQSGQHWTFSSLNDLEEFFSRSAIEALSFHDK